MRLTIETDREVDGRWIAEVVELPGVVLYARTEADAVNRVKDLARRVLAERLANNEAIPGELTFEQRHAA